MRVYLDAAPVIYLVEQVQSFLDDVIKHVSGRDTIRVCSDMTRLECRIKPLRLEESIVLSQYDLFFAHGIHEIVPLDRAVIDKATELRAKYNFKTPDSIHLAAAIISQCDIFLTNDRRLTRCTDILVQTI